MRSMSTPQGLTALRSGAQRGPWHTGGLWGQGCSDHSRQMLPGVCASGPVLRMARTGHNGGLQGP